jgi:hypothetical protein
VGRRAQSGRSSPVAGSWSRSRQLLTAAALALSSACASSSQEVKVIHSQAAATALDRVYVVVFQGQVDWDRAEKLRQALAEALQSQAGAVATMAVAGSELDKGPARIDIDAFKPDGVVVVKPASGVTPKEGGGTSVSYDVMVLDRKLERTLWRAMLVSEAGPELMAQDLVKHLGFDGLLARKTGDEPARNSDDVDKKSK